MSSESLQPAFAEDPDAVRLATSAGDTKSLLAREWLVKGVNGTPLHADVAWQVIQAWDALEAERDRLATQLAHVKGHMKGRCEHLQARVEELAGALRYYAEGRIWDHGETAREALDV